MVSRTRQCPYQVLLAMAAVAVTAATGAEKECRESARVGCISRHRGPELLPKARHENVALFDRANVKKELSALSAYYSRDGTREKG